ncbi:MAG: glutaredoxin 3 [Cellvibrionaceae bacterium]
MSEIDAPVTLYTTRFCPYCVRAKGLLDHKSVAYREISVDGNAELRNEMMSKSGRHTVPQIWVGSTHVGGCDELMALERAGQLDTMLSAVTN